jgi:cell division control protein 12
MAPQASESASPIGIANLPNQRHKIVAKRGAGFTIMVGSDLIPAQERLRIRAASLCGLARAD